jgi:hypothetical protein
MILLHATRAGGGRVHVRFRGVKESTTDHDPNPGDPLRLKGVGGSPLWAILVPPFLRTTTYSTRVRIDAGTARLEIVCEDVEWWEDGT